MTEDQLKRRIGVVVLIVLLVGICLVLKVDRKHLRGGMRIHVAMARLGALREAAKVRVSGRVIGEVEKIRLIPFTSGGEKTAHVVLDLWIANDHAWLLRKSSEYFISQQSILSEAYLEVGAPRDAEPGEALRDGDTVPGISPPELDRLVQVSWDNLHAITEVMREHRPQYVALNQALEELRRNLDEVEAEPGTLARAWAAGMRVKAEAILLRAHIERSTLSAEVIESTTQRAQALAERIESEAGRLQQRMSRWLLRIERLRDRIDPERFRQLQDTGARLGSLMAKVQGILVGTQALATMVVRGEGTLGAFLNDTEIADEIKQLTKMAKQQPWLTIGHP